MALFAYPTAVSWREIYAKLKESGLSFREINEYIGTDFKNQVYKNYGMKEKSFKKLLGLLSENIPHKVSKRIVTRRNYRKFTIEENFDLAEFIGIMLGDGHLAKKYLAVTLNGVDEKEYVNYVITLFKKIFIVEPFIHNPKNNKAIQIRSSYIGILEELRRLGLKTGNKVKHQVDVPE